VRPNRELDHKHEGVHAIDWPEFAELCRKLARDVAGRGGTDCVVGIAKGGAIVGAVVSAMLRCDYYPIRLSRRHAGSRVKMTTRVPVPPSRDVKGRSVVLCDDLSVSGETFKIALIELKQVGAGPVTTAALCRHTHSYAPDLTALVGDEAFIFPWDRDVLVEGEFRLHPEIARGLAAQGLPVPAAPKRK
jgi:uncharacterized protein